MGPNLQLLGMIQATVKTVTSAIYSIVIKQCLGQLKVLAKYSTRETQLKFCKGMAVPALLYRSEL